MASARVTCYEPAFASRAQLASRMRYEPALAPRALPERREIHEVWESNLDAGFDALLAAVAKAGGKDAIVAFDTEFPGFPCEDHSSSHAKHYQVLRENIDQCWPIQLGLAIVSARGVHYGAWNFNFRFDSEVDVHTEESLAFLRTAGLNFPRHRTEGVSALAFGQRLANSSLMGHNGGAPIWVTFSGSYDWGYLLKLVTRGRALPGLASTFDQVLSVYCPKRRELRDLLPRGSLEALGRRHGVKRWGLAHTAGSDALLTLELFMLLGGHEKQASSDKQHAAWQPREDEEWSEWSDVRSEGSWHSSQESLGMRSEGSWHSSQESLGMRSEGSWHSSQEWYPQGEDQWYGGSQAIHVPQGQVAAASWEDTSWATQSQPQKVQVQMTSGPWGSGTWATPSQNNDHWWYSAGIQPTWYASL